MLGGYVSLKAKTSDIEVTADDCLPRNENKGAYSKL